MDVDRREALEEGRREELHVAGADDQLDAFLRRASPAMARSRSSREAKSSSGKTPCECLRCSPRSRAGRPPCSTRRPRSGGQRRGAPAGSCRRRRRERRSHEPPDGGACARIARRHDCAHADAEVEDAPLLVLRTPRSASQSKTGGRSQDSQSISAPTPLGATRGTLPRIPPPVTCASALTSARDRSARTSST